jgi:hypothetical protein
MSITINGSGTITGSDRAASADVLPKRLLQSVTYQTGAVATGTTLIPHDSSIPQITEGDQYLSLAITPTSAASMLEIDVTLVVSNSGPQYQAVALFQGAIANALTVASANVVAGGETPVTFKHIMTAGTTSATTFSVRSGGNIAGTTTINGNSSTGFYGGVMASRITIKEFAA